MTAFLWIMTFVVTERAVELALAHYNTKKLLAAGGHEVGVKHYSLFIILHASWIGVLIVFVPWSTQPSWALIGIFGFLQILRIWVISSLGRFWTTRIITLENAPLHKKGPYRFCKHPNYCIVAGEIAILPLAFGAWPIALIWSVFNALLLGHRIKIENAALLARADK